MAAQINFFKEGVTFRLSKADDLKKWISSVAKKEKHGIGEINFIFCTDAFLRKMNKQYLQHDYNTDIITFDNSEETKTISGDIFISIDRVRVNAKEFKTTFDDELHRVMVHGVLHLLGYDDKTEKLKKEMRKMEDAHMNKLRITSRSFGT